MAISTSSFLSNAEDRILHAALGAIIDDNHPSFRRPRERDLLIETHESEVARPADIPTQLPTE
jgi:hypothetical protein